MSVQIINYHDNVSAAKCNSFITSARYSKYSMTHSLHYNFRGEGWISTEKHRDSVCMTLYLRK